MFHSFYAVVKYSDSRFISHSLRLAKDYARKNNCTLIVEVEINPSLSNLAWKCVNVYRYKRVIGCFCKYEFNEYMILFRKGLVYDY